MSKNNNTKKLNSREDYEQLGRTIEKLLIKDYVDLLASTKRQLWSSFVRGIFYGLGYFIGATFVVALLLFILNYLGGAPVIGHFFQQIIQAINSKQ
jgi:VIT1/CCC1 family predicted Fe2+/Mn2+ transporter